MDSSGNLYIADSVNHVVLKVTADGRYAVAAGNAIAGYSGEGGAAVNASLNYPTAVAVDPAGNILIADYNNDLIRRVGADGKITTIAGFGTANVGHSGDGGPATQAQLGGPVGLAVDPAGNIFISENSNFVRKIDTHGIITTVAGTGSKMSAGDGGLATAASLFVPVALAVDAQGSLYIGESAGNRIRKINQQGVISTFAGTGQAGFSGDGGPATRALLSGPSGLQLDRAGDLLIVDTQNNCVRMVDLSGNITTIAGNRVHAYSGDGGLALNASFSSPNGLAIDGTGRLYVADSGNLRVRRLSVGGTVTTVAGNGLYQYNADNSPALQTYFGLPIGLALDKSGNLVVADYLSNSVRLIQANGQVKNLAGVSNAGGYAPDGPAASHLLSQPVGVAVAADGTIYVAEQFAQLIRKITPDGNLVTVAGVFNSFQGGYAGDGGPAVKASLNSPAAIALDSTGNLYISDAANHCIRKVDHVTGLIGTFAGKCTSPGFSGDGGAATSAQISGPGGLAFDSANTLYFVDTGNNRIRTVTSSGTIKTFAGNGRVGVADGNGGPALSATLFLGGTFASTGQEAIFVDGTGNVYFTQANLNQVRRIGPDGIITQVAGTGTQGLSGDGGTATTATFFQPGGVVVDASGKVYVSDTFNSRIRTVLTVSPVLAVAPTQLTLSASAGSADNPPINIAVSTTLSGSLSSGLAYSIATDPSSPWLNVAPSSGLLPQALSVTADATSLGAGQYSGSFTILAPGASPAAVTVSVNLTVAAGIPAQLVLGSQAVSFSGVQGGAASTSIITINNAGGGSATFSATSQSVGGAWLSISPASGKVTNGSPSSITVTATPGSLAAGTYPGIVTVSTPGIPSVQVAVTFSVTKPSHVILLSQTGLTFTGIASGGKPLSQNFGILNIGQGSMDWSAAAVSPSGDSVPWLSLSAANGTVNTPYLDVSLIDVSVDQTGLAPGDYYARIQVSSVADNSPQTVSVLLTVKPAGTAPSIDIQPSGMIFTGLASNPPGSQMLRIVTLGSQNVDYTSKPLTFDGGSWLTFQPDTGTIVPGQNSTLTVQPNFAALSTGVYNGVITFLFSDNTVRNVKVLTVVAPGTATASSAASAKLSIRAPAAAGGCVPSGLQIQLTTGQFDAGGILTVPFGQPTKIQVKMAGACSGTAFTTGQVTTLFDSNEPSLTMTHVGNGVWEATWTPTANPSKYPNVGLTINAIGTIGTQPVGQTSPIARANIVGGTSVPVISRDGVVSAANVNGLPAAGLGALVTIYGSQLTDGSPAGAAAIPLPTQLAGTQVLLQGKPIPILFSAAGQINVQVPYDITPNVQQSLLVQRGSAFSASVPLSIASTQPAIFQNNAQGQGVIVDANNAIQDSSHPAHAGSSVVIYCTGLGPVIPAIPAGSGAPGPTSLVNPVTVTIGGQNAVIQYAGLTPGSPGLYQVNVVIPANVSGDTVPVVLTQGNQSSPPATMSVH